LQNKEKIPLRPLQKAKMMTGNSTVTRVSAPFSLTEMTASISSSVSVSTWKNASEKMLHSV